jgi:hypothetical protein
MLQVASQYDSLTSDTVQRCLSICKSMFRVNRKLTQDTAYKQEYLDRILQSLLGFVTKVFKCEDRDLYKPSKGKGLKPS